MAMAYLVKKRPKDMMMSSTILAYMEKKLLTSISTHLSEGMITW
jgi:hypothetical protein